MTIEQCYKKLGGDYRKVCSRLPGRRFVERFLARYLEEDSAQALLTAVKAGNPEESYRYAIALKGVAGNLGFGNLERAAAELENTMRTGGGISPEVQAQAETIRQCQMDTVQAIQMYLQAK